MICIAILFAIIIVGICIVADNRKKSKAEKSAKQAEENRIKNLIPKFLERLQKAQTLNELFILHLQIWGSGIRHENFGPDKYGIFRTDDIMTMTKDEVFLGNIDGYWTQTLSFWENYEDLPKCIVNQYKNILISNLKSIKK